MWAFNIITRSFAPQLVAINFQVYLDFNEFVHTAIR